MKSHRLLSLLVILALALSTMGVAGSAVPSTALARSPFVGVWRAIDFVDGSLMRVTILGPANGPFLITWTESYFTFCDGGAGAAAGKGSLDPANPNVLQAHLRLRCFRTGATVEWDQVWEYRASYDDLLSSETPGVQTIWKRLSQPIAPRATFVAYLPGAAEGYDWPMGHTITLSVPDRGYSVQAVSEQRPDSPEGETRVLFEVWRDDFFFEAGDHIFVTDPAIGLAKDTVITDLAVTGFDLQAGTVSGIFDPALSLWVWLYDGEGQVPSMEGDAWTATFAPLPPGAWGGATQMDVDYDGTSIDFQVPKPRFSVFPEQEYVEGWQWPEGATVSVSVEGKPECNASGTSGHPEWDPHELFVGIDLPQDCDVAAGDRVTLTDGVTPRTHDIRNLAVTEVNTETDTVRGEADAGAEVHVWPHGYDEVLASVGADSLWAATFSTDLVQDMSGRSEIRDGEGNATAVEWFTPSVRLIAFPAVDEVFGYGWPEGSEVSLSINAGEFVQVATVAPSPWGDPNDILAYFSFGEAYNLTTNDVVSLSGSGLEEAHTVRRLTVTNVDATANTVAGTADDDQIVNVYTHEFNDKVVPATPSSGTWLADMDDVGVDLQAGKCGRADIWDPIGNSTSVDWCVEIAGTGDLYAVPDENRIWANGWLEGGEIHLTIFDPEGSELYAETRTVPPPSQNPWSEVLFESGFDLEPGQRLVIEQDEYARELIVSSIRVTGLDLGTKTIFGAGDPGAGFIVGINGVDVEATVGGDGTWAVQHGNLTGGVWGGVIQLDADGDSTRDIFAAPNPNFYAVPDENRILANEWIEGGVVSLTIFSPGGGEIYSETRSVPPPSANPWTEVLFESGFVLEAGQRLLMDQDGYQRELIVSAIRVTGFDLGTQTVYGTGDPGAQFVLQIGDIDAWGTVAGDTTWSVQNANLTSGVWGSAIQPDADGDSTRDIFQAPSP